MWVLPSLCRRCRFRYIGGDCIPNGPAQNKGVGRPTRSFGTSTLDSIGDFARKFSEKLAPCETQASLLRIYLETWLGPEVFKENAGGQFDLQSLVGRPAEVVLVHICNESHPKPFVDIQGIYPPGTLTLTYTGSGDQRRGQ